MFNVSINILNFLFFSSLLVIAFAIEDSRTDNENINPNELLDWCIDARFHKSRPGPSDSLHDQCKPWSKRSCCTENTSRDLHKGSLYNFNYDHCMHVSSKPMSEKCRAHFIKDLCFYECSPNLGPWVVKVEQKMRRERAYHVPLCASECTDWFNDCASELTCTDNWARNFDWYPTGNKCKLNTSCKTFLEIYKSAENFCERVWDHSWKVVPDSEPCMKIWFSTEKNETNPNDEVAREKVRQIIKSNKLVGLNSSTLSSSHMSLFTFIIGILVIGV